MPLIAITGGTATGKSTTLGILKNAGAVACDADDIVHSMYETDTALHETLRHRWGQAVFSENGKVDRARIAEHIFNNENERSWLSALIHPKVWHRLRQLEEFNRSTTVFCAVPLLFEIGWEGRFALTVAVWCPAQEQRRRLRARNWPEERLRSTLKSQLSADEKLQRADVGLINHGSPELLRAQVKRLPALPT